MKGLIRVSLSNPQAIIVMSLAIAILGALALMRIPVDILPVFKSPAVALRRDAFQRLNHEIPAGATAGALRHGVRTAQHDRGEHCAKREVSSTHFAATALRVPRVFIAATTWVLTPLLVNCCWPPELRSKFAAFALRMA